jgi:hypothetical protein
MSRKDTVPMCAELLLGIINKMSMEVSLAFLPFSLTDLSPLAFSQATDTTTAWRWERASPSWTLATQEMFYTVLQSRRSMTASAREGRRSSPTRGVLPSAATDTTRATASTNTSSTIWSLPLPLCDLYMAIGCCYLLCQRQQWLAIERLGQCGYDDQRSVG